MELIMAMRYVIMILVAVYLFFYIKRSLGFYGVPVKKLWVRLACGVIAVAVSYLCTNFFSTTALVILHVGVASVLMDLINLVLKHVRKNKDKRIIWDKIYRCGLVPLAAMAVVLLYGYFHMGHIYEQNYTVETSKEIRAEGYRLVLLTDLHFGTTMDVEKLEEQCRRINETQPDMVVLCGDIVDEHTTKEEVFEAFGVFGGIDSKFGVYYVYGNHDRATYRQADFNADDLRQAILENGITILQETGIEINGELTLVGREDRGFAGESGRMSIEALLSGADKDSFIIVADHQPVELEQNSSAGVDLQISGHTHGGQIFPVGIISDWLGFGELNYGKESFGSMEAIVSSGIAGWGYPIRTGSNSEYVVIDIQKQE